jgi:hypothetical protein
MIRRTDDSPLPAAVVSGNRALFKAMTPAPIMQAIRVPMTM